ncbi:MAG: hypothetical protein M3081_07200 [Gemmatimonadota bacterium]|nr:hypothetical protein [Gemmatimonadota bacterium]
MSTEVRMLRMASGSAWTPSVPQLEMIVKAHSVLGAGMSGRQRLCREAAVVPVFDFIGIRLSVEVLRHASEHRDGNGCAETVHGYLAGLIGVTTIEQVNVEGDGFPAGVSITA